MGMLSTVELVRVESDILILRIHGKEKCREHNKAVRGRHGKRSSEEVSDFQGIKEGDDADESTVNVWAEEGARNW